jgi:mercuric ion transport protein
MRSSLTASGSSIAATLLVLVSSECCVGPLAVALSFVGLSSSTLLLIENSLGPYRPYVLALTLAALAIGFYSAYRPVASACAPGQPCARRESRRVQRALLWAATALLLALIYFTYVHPNLDLYFGIYL